MQNISIEYMQVIPAPIRVAEDIDEEECSISILDICARYQFKSIKYSFKLIEKSVFKPKDRGFLIDRFGYNETRRLMFDKDPLLLLDASFF